MIRVGIPRGLYFYKYSTLWQTFFEGLGAEVIVSDKTNKNILINGANTCVSEACLPIKVYFGHVMNLVGKVDLIFMPRFTSISRNQYICPEIGVNFVRSLNSNTSTVFEDANALFFNVYKFETLYDLENWLKEMALTCINILDSEEHKQSP